MERTKRNCRATPVGLALSHHSPGPGHLLVGHRGQALHRWFRRFFAGDQLMGPPLITTKAQVDEMMAILHDSMKAFEGEVL